MAIENNQVVNGKLATITAIVTNPVTGVREFRAMEEVRELTATINLTNVPVNRLGKTYPMYLQTGWNGTGNMSGFYTHSVIVDLIEQYINDGLQVQFDMVVTNEDPNSAPIIGRQTIQLHNCKPETYGLVQVGVDDDYLTTDFDFVFENVSFVEKFQNPNNN